jgi:hypothetical protein
MSESENEYDENEQFTKEEDDKMADQSATSEGAEASGEVKEKYDPKDPLRPRRKKARRACFACQRAHLTCGKPASPVRGVCSFLQPLLEPGVPAFSARCRGVM